MIRLVTQFDDNRVRATAATPTCAACCSCCCCCVTTALSSATLTGLSFGRLTAHQEQPLPEVSWGFRKTAMLVVTVVVATFLQLMTIVFIAGWIVILSSPRAKLNIPRWVLKVFVVLQVTSALIIVDISLAVWLGLFMGIVGVFLYVVLALIISAVIWSRRRSTAPTQFTSAPIPSTADFTIPPPNTALPSRDFIKPEEESKE